VETVGHVEAVPDRHVPDVLVSTERAATTAAGILMAFAGLQVSLAAGAPLGAHVWGNSQPAVLPAGMRAASGGAAVVLASAAWVVTARAGLVRPPAASRSLGIATWAIGGYLTLNTLANLASASPVERRVFAPATAVAAALTTLVAWRTRD